MRSLPLVILTSFLAPSEWALAQQGEVAAPTSIQQSAGAPSPSDRSARGAHACMVGKVDTVGPPQFTVAVVPMKQRGGMEERGYSAIDCGNVESEIPAYRARVCSIADEAPAQDQASFQRKNKVSSRELCDMATTVEGGQ